MNVYTFRRTISWIVFFAFLVITCFCVLAWLAFTNGGTGQMRQVEVSNQLSETIKVVVNRQEFDQVILPRSSVLLNGRTFVSTIAEVKAYSVKTNKVIFEKNFFGDALDEIDDGSRLKITVP